MTKMTKKRTKLKKRKKKRKMALTRDSKIPPPLLNQDKG